MRKQTALLIAVALLLGSCGKPAPKIPRAPVLVQLRQEFKANLPIKAGEQLVYEIKITRFPLFATAGEITFDYLGAELEPKVPGLDFSGTGLPLLHFRAVAVSRGLLIKIFGITVNDRFEALVDPHRFRTIAVLKAIDENKKHSIQTGIFDYQSQEARYRTLDPTKPEAPAREVTLKLEPDMVDLLAAFYFVRLQELKEGSLIRFPMAFDSERSELEIAVVGKETIDTSAGRTRTVRIEPKIFGKGRLIKRDGELTMWLTDDERHVPLRATAKVFGATVNAELIRKR